jgi:coenzyme F420-reducing hydrogenase alpha subunit
LHAPDFLGYEDVIQMAADHPDLVKMALRLKKLGNDIMVFLGGREIHPINSRVGGFYKVPQKKELAQKFPEELKWAREACIKTIRLVATLDFPDYTYDYEYVALRHPDHYAIDDGRIVSNRGIDIPVQDFEKHYQEMHIRHANALHSVHIGVGPYKVGPLARYSLNYNQLTPLCKEEAKAAGLGPTCNNPFQSIIVRSVETLYAVEESLRLIDKYEMPDAPAFKVVPKAGVGCGASEAPRGLLYHRYRLDEKGIIQEAKITPPTAQNQPSIENDLRLFVDKRLDMPQDKLTWQCEQMIRNYDPCISCATHFLKLKVERE